jgi:uncharacterized lipoprotein (TIGR02269 family)
MRHGWSARFFWLLGLLLAACAPADSSLRGDYESPELLVSWEQARSSPGCVVLLCDEEYCALVRCRDAEEVQSPSVVLTRGTLAVQPPLSQRASRWWGHPLAAPTLVEPVFEIPWRNWKTRSQHLNKDIPLYCLPAPEPMERHHIFPQQAVLAEWFRSKGISIHAFTIPVPRSFHHYLHSGGPEGGMWNEAWRQFKDKNPGATQEEIWRFAGELMIRFKVNGHLVPYCR